MAAKDAVTIAKDLSKIGFPEFTSKLVTDVFDAMISANLRQIAAYAELVSVVARGLTDFINDTKDDITGEEIVNLLVKVMPDKTGTKVRKDNDNPISVAEAEKLNAALTVRDASGAIIEPSNFTKDKKYSECFAAITTAAAKRLAANKYDTLEKMVRMGFMRLVVESGTIETRLNFSTWGNDYTSECTSEYISSTTRTHKAPGFLSLFTKNLEISNKYSVEVQHASSSSYSSTGSNVNVFGQVVINFKTDYMPLDKV